MLQTPRIASTRLLANGGEALHFVSRLALASQPSTSIHKPSASPAYQRSRSHQQPPHLSVQGRSFHTTRSFRMKEFFPEPDAPHINKTKPAWQHPIYTQEQLDSIVIAHRNAKNWSDYIALGAVRFMRFFLDRATGYKHGKDRHGNEFAMTERKYMIRNIFLESVAGVPGMVAGMLRHLRSMRTMRRDNGWMETLLEESYNERMHLLTFLKMAEPGYFMRLMVLGAQGVFFNGFFLSYLISPKICHRFVGYLEEEAVLTYTRELQDIDAGKLPKWANMTAPDIAIEYWKMPQGKRSMRDLLLYIRADEAKHREVNHTLGNLDQREDPNPFVSEYKDQSKPHPSKGIENIRPTGWEREEII